MLSSTTSVPSEVEAFASALAHAKERPRAPIHAFHRWYGKLVPAIPAAAIETFTEPDELVLDPFCGSGTTLVEAVRAGRRAAGSDVSPLACLLSRVKTRSMDLELLRAAIARAETRIETARAAKDPTWRERLPEFPNRDHYYPDPVARDLLHVFEAARAESDPACREWLLALASAINRDVSNADRRHVFPGVSKRMRALIADGWRADVMASWRRTATRRMRATESLADETRRFSGAVAVHEGQASSMPGDDGSAVLLVTNPPYVSSIRYVETFKLEAFWLDVTPGELRALDERTLGTERVSREPVAGEELDAVPQPTARDAAAALAADEPRLARCVAAWATGLDASVERACHLLRRDARAVVKLSPSRLRGTVIDSPAIATESWERHGARLLGVVDDAYAPGSRSLTTARNWYSGRMDSDSLLLFATAP